MRRLSTFCPYVSVSNDGDKNANAECNVAVCYLPKWFPGAGFLRYAAEANIVRQTMTDDLFDYAWQSKVAAPYHTHYLNILIPARQQNDTENLSLMSQLLEKFGDTIETDDKLKNTIKACGGVMYAGA